MQYLVLATTTLLASAVPALAQAPLCPADLICDGSSPHCNWLFCDYPQTGIEISPGLEIAVRWIILVMLMVLLVLGIRYEVRRWKIKKQL